jgi:DNA-directed RNA polymerase alpha subunit
MYFGDTNAPEQLEIERNGESFLSLPRGVKLNINPKLNHGRIVVSFETQIKMKFHHL